MRYIYIILFIVFLIYSCSPSNKSEDAKMLLKKAMSTMKEKDYGLAIPLFTKLLKKEKNIDANYHRGLCYLSVGNYESAQNDFKIVLKEKNNAAALLSYGITLSKMKKYDLALDFYNNAINIAPEYPYAYNDLGYLYEKTQKYHDAILNYSKSISRIDNIAKFLTPLYNRSYVYMKIKENRKALDDIDRIINLNTKKPSDYLYRLIIAEKISGIEVDKTFQMIKDNIDYFDSSSVSVYILKILIGDMSLEEVISERIFSKNELSFIYCYIAYKYKIIGDNSTATNFFRISNYLGEDDNFEKDLSSWELEQLCSNEPAMMYRNP